VSELFAHWFGFVGLSDLKMLAAAELVLLQGKLLLIHASLKALVFLIH